MHTGVGGVNSFVIIGAAVRRRRHNAIIEMVRAREISSQDELLKGLRSRGIEVSQSTLSRDIQELGLAKAGGVYTLVGQEVLKIAPTGDAIRRILREFVVDVSLAQGIVVIKTGPGSTGPVAEALDDARWPEEVGTLAGENTIFVAVRSQRDGAKLVKRMREILA